MQISLLAFQGISGCSQGCQNTLGSFSCFCRRAGYVLDSDQRSCKGEIWKLLYIQNGLYLL